MPEVRVSFTQSGADTATGTTIATGLTVDGKAGWLISEMEVYWVNSESAVAADYELQAALMSESAAISLVSLDTIELVSWAVQNTAGVAVAFPVEPIKRKVLFEPRVTVQPLLHIRTESNGTGQANQVIYRVKYEIVKLTDIEVLRLFAAGG